MVVPEGVLIDVALEMLAADGVVDPPDAVPEQGPEPLDRVRVDIPDHVHLLRVVDALVSVALPAQLVVHRVLVGEDYGLRQHLLFDDRLDRGAAYVPGD